MKKKTTERERERHTEADNEEVVLKRYDEELLAQLLTLPEEAQCIAVQPS